MSETVILVHGIWMPKRVMGLLARRLRRCGYRTIMLGYPSLARTLESNADQLAGLIRRQGNTIVHLAGHSLGGLIILQTLQKHPDLVKGRIVLLGCPVRGSAVARSLARSRGLRWMLGRSADGGLLEAAAVWRGSVPLGVIAGNRPIGIGQITGSLSGENDGTVSVSETRLEHASAAIEVKTTHTGLIFSREVADEVCNFLRDGHFSPL